ncbi:MAG: DUF2892 domain-containing protein [Chloroflexi bacterium]|nr:DUF2892 domain-containing protein [Chloroflexota bacterium]
MDALRVLIVVVALIASVVAMPGEASAHQPRMPVGDDVTILDPEVSKAYYTTLDGRGHTYRIRATVPFDLYVSITVPAISGQGTDISAVIARKDGNGGTVATLDGVAQQWTKFFEPFGFSDYLQGPEYRGRAEAGEYDIRVSSPRNDQKYVLVVGEIEAFDFKETMNALELVPLIKRDFFGETPATFLFSPMGFAYVAAVFASSFGAGALFRRLLRRVRWGGSRRPTRNIGLPDRMVRVGIGLALFAWAVTTTWDPVTLFISGFCLYEGIARWCVLHSAIGRNTCPA